LLRKSAILADLSRLPAIRVNDAQITRPMTPATIVVDPAADRRFASPQPRRGALAVRELGSARRRTGSPEQASTSPGLILEGLVGGAVVTRRGR
jgi:hypothetical protein